MNRVQRTINKEQLIEKNKIFIIHCSLFFVLCSLVFVLCTCDLKPDESGLSADGIVIYSGREILNDRTVEIVTNRVQRLMATAPSGHKIQWISGNPDFIEINDAGVIRTSRTPNKEVIIKAVSINDPAVQAQVTFRTKGLR